MAAFGIESGEAAVLFATTLILIAVFLIARVANARQPIALAFAVMMPLLLTWAMQGLAVNGNIFL